MTNVDRVGAYYKYFANKLTTQALEQDRDTVLMGMQLTGQLIVALFDIRDALQETNKLTRRLNGLPEATET